MPLFAAPKIRQLESLSWKLRLDVLDTVYKNGGHIGGSLSSLDLLVSLYFGNIFKFSENRPMTEDDKFVLSAGHLAVAYYTILAEKNYFKKSLLDTYAQFGSILQGHSSTKTPGIVYSSGSLGQGLSFASGLAYAHKFKKSKKYITCLTTDGEHQEGQIWEAVMFAAKYKLTNLVNIVDYNKYQIDGSVEDIMPLDDLALKYLNFGWTVKEINGHDYNQLLTALAQAKKSPSPTCIVAHTVFGRGVSFMQYDYKYHDIKSLPQNLYQTAVTELSQKI